MFERLGKILGWTGNCLAFLTLIFWAEINLKSNGLMSISAAVSGALITSAIALAFFGIGRALRNIFAGRE